MTEAGWTREKPTAAGLYWFREAPTKEPHVVKVWGEHGFMRVLEMWRELSEALDDFDGEFKGPITPDSYQQGRVAGLAKAVEIIKANTDVKKAIEIIRLHSLAQQAQGGVGDDLFILP